MLTRRFYKFGNSNSNDFYMRKTILYEEKTNSLNSQDLIPYYTNVDDIPE